MLILLTDELDKQSLILSSSTRTFYLIDSNVLSQSLGKPKKCRAFSDYANIFSKSIARYFSTVSQVDAVLDQYDQTSIKWSTTSKQKGIMTPIQNMIDHGDLGLLKKWTTQHSIRWKQTRFGKLSKRKSCSLENLTKK